mgnify:CR=1 FL=1
MSKDSEPEAPKADEPKKHALVMTHLFQQMNDGGASVGMPCPYCKRQIMLKLHPFTEGETVSQLEI